MEGVIEFLLKTEHELEHYLLIDNHIVLSEAVPWTLCWAIIWGLLDSMYTKDSKYFVSSLHSIVVSLAGFVNLMLGHNKYEYIVFYILSGYFFADFFLHCLKREFMIYGIHHFVTVAATYRMINGRSWNESLFASSCWLFEASTPFLNHYKIHRSLNSAIVFALVFFLIRVVWLTILAVDGLTRCTNRLDTFLLSSFTLLNYYWFYDIVKMGMRKSKEDGKKKGQ